MSKSISGSLIDMEFDYIDGLRRQNINETDVMKLRDKVLQNAIVPKKISLKKVSRQTSNEVKSDIINRIFYPIVTTVLERM